MKHTFIYSRHITENNLIQHKNSLPVEEINE